MDFSNFSEHPNLLAELSDKSDGSGKLWSDGNPKQNETLANRKKFFESLEIKPEHVVGALLAHGNKVQAVSEEQAGQTIPDVDGLVTQTPGLYLSITVADCLPIFFYDPINKAIGIAHAGWRGLASKIIPATIETLRTNYDSKPEDILAGIGPGIGPCHFEVKADLLAEFQDYPPEALCTDEQGKSYLDLPQIASEQLEAAGILIDNIDVDPTCTFCETSQYFSYRRDKPKVLEAMVAVIGLEN